MTNTSRSLLYKDYFFSTIMKYVSLTGYFVKLQKNKLVPYQMKIVAGGLEKRDGHHFLTTPTEHGYPGLSMAKKNILPYPTTDTIP